MFALLRKSFNEHASGNTGRMKRILACLLVAASVLVGGACDDDSDGQNVREEVEDAVGGATALAAAESMRAALEAQDLGSGETLRSVSVLQENADDVPGDPEVSGIADADGDGNDDDGQVELKVGDQAACVTVTSQNDVSVDDGACSAGSGS